MKHLQGVENFSVIPKFPLLTRHVYPRKTLCMWEMFDSSDTARVTASKIHGQFLKNLVVGLRISISQESPIE